MTSEGELGCFLKSMCKVRWIYTFRWWTPLERQRSHKANMGACQSERGHPCWGGGSVFAAVTTTMTAECHTKGPLILAARPKKVHITIKWGHWPHVRFVAFSKGLFRRFGIEMRSICSLFFFSFLQLWGARFWFCLLYFFPFIFVTGRDAWHSDIRGDRDQTDFVRVSAKSVSSASKQGQPRSGLPLPSFPLSFSTDKILQKRKLSS